MPSTPLANGTVRVRPSTISFLAHLLPIAKPGSPRPPQLLAREEKRRWQPLPPFSCGRAAPLLRPRLPEGRSRRSCCCRSSARRGSGGPRCARRRRPLIGGSRRTLSDDLLGMPPLLSIALTHKESLTATAGSIRPPRLFEIWIVCIDFFGSWQGHRSGLLPPLIWFSILIVSLTVVSFTGLRWKHIDRIDDRRPDLSH